MSEVTHRITSLAELQPRFLALLCVGLLFKLAGQQKFSVTDLAQYNKEYDGLRLLFDEKQNAVTITLHREGEDEVQN